MKATITTLILSACSWMLFSIYPVSYRPTFLLKKEFDPAIPCSFPFVLFDSKSVDALMYEVY